METIMEYEKKFEEMQKYIPFLEKMINRLESTQTGASNPREAQLTKIKALRNYLLDKNKRMKMENLLKCEQVLLNLYSKLEEAKIMSISPTEHYQIKKEVLEDKPAQVEPVADLQSVREKLKIVSNVKESKIDPTSSPRSPASRDLDRATNKPAGSSSNPAQIRSKVHVPHLFERRPRRTSKSKSQSPPHHRTQITDLSSHNTKTYTRVLKSPEGDTKKWNLSSPQKPYDSQDVQLFQRRSPRRRASHSLSPRKSKNKSHKREKDRSLLRPNVDLPSNCSQTDVNITLDVPKESLSSFGASNIFERIMQCNKDDVDIKHLRELRTQIVSELRQTGVNNDISEYILKSYKKKKKRRARVEEIEEGEIPDSESESVQKIYSNMSIEVKNNNAEEQIDHGNIELKEKNKNLNTSTKTMTEQERRKDSPKIKISLTFSNTKVDNLCTASESAPLPKPITTFLLDIANDEELRGSGSETSLCAIKSEADTSASFYGDLEIDECFPSEVTSSLENISNITLTSAEIINKKSDITNKLSFESDVQATVTSQKVKNASTDKGTLIKKDKTSDTSTNPSSTNIIGKSSDEHSKNDLKVYNVQAKPSKPYRSDTNPIDNLSIDSTLLKNVADAIEAVSKPKEFYLPLSDVQADKDLTDLLYKDLSPSNTPRTTASTKEKENSKQKSTDYIQEPMKSSCSSSTEDKANKSASEVISEIEILKALKSEILAESIHLHKLDGETPSLHQPKISKVIDKTQLEVNQKKRISLENYKKKTTPAQKGIFVRQAEKEQAKLLSRALTPRECERFQMILKGPLDEGMSDEDIQISTNTLNKSDDMGPKSPEDDNFSDEVPGSPIIIPSDPVQIEDRSSLPEHVKKDVDMRIHQSSPHINKCPTASPQQQFSNPNFTSLPNMDTKDGHDRSKGIMNSPNHHTNKGRNPNSLLGHRHEPLLNTPAIPSLLATAVMHPSMTPSRTPAMTPSRAPPITPSRVLMTPSYTPMFDDNVPARRHVYAPLDLPDPSRTPLWDMTSPRIRDDGSSTPVWENNDPRSVPMRDVPGTPLWDNLGGRSPMITDSPNELGFCTPRHDPFNRIGEYNRSNDPLVSSSDNSNKNRIPRDPRLRPERRDDTASHESRTPTFSHSNRSTGDTLLDSRNNRESRQYGQPFYEGSHRRFDYDVAMDDNMNRGRYFNRASSVGRNIGSDQNFGRNMSHEPSIARNAGREPSVGHNVGRELNIGPHMNRETNFERNMCSESSLGRNIGREPSIGYNIDREVSIGRRNDGDNRFGHYIDRERSDGRNFVRAQSVGRNLGRAQSVGRNLGRAKSVQRDMGYELDFGCNTDRERSVGRETSVGRNLRPDTSLGHNINRDRSVGRDMARERSVGHEFGYESIRERGTSVGRNLGREQSDIRNMRREQSVGRNMGREQSVGRNVTLEQSAARNTGCEPSSGRNFGREQSVGRKVGHEPSVGRNIVPDPSVERVANTSRLENIEYQSNKREKNTNRKDNISVRRKGYERSDSVEQEESDRNSLRIVGSNNRDPRSRRDLYESSAKSRANSSKSSSNNSSPRIGHSKVPNEKYNRSDPKRITSIADYGSRTERKDQNVYERDRKKSIGMLSYTSDNLAKGKLLSQGYGVKNYKIPKIRRPVKEIAKEEINTKADDKTERKEIPSTSKDQTANEKVTIDKERYKESTDNKVCNSARVGSEEKKVRMRPHKRRRIICNPAAPEKKKNPNFDFMPKDKNSSNTSDSSRSSSSSEFDEIMSRINQHLVNRSSDSDESAKKIPITSKKVDKDRMLKVSSNTTNTSQTDTLHISPKNKFEPAVSMPLSALNDSNTHKVNAFDVTQSADDTPQINTVGTSNVTNLTNSITSASNHTPEISKLDTSAIQLLKTDINSPSMMGSTKKSIIPQEDLLHEQSKPVDKEVSIERVNYEVNVDKDTINYNESKTEVLADSTKNEMIFESIIPKKHIFGDELTQSENVIAAAIDKTTSLDEPKLPWNNEIPTEALNENLHSAGDKSTHSAAVIESKAVSKSCEHIHAKSIDEIKLLENDEKTTKTKENLYSKTVLTNEDSKLRIKTDVKLPISDSVENIKKNDITPNIIESEQSMRDSESEIQESILKNKKTTYMIDTQGEAKMLNTDTSLNERHSSIPDSTMTNEGSEITQDEILPDSTQTSEMNTDASSVVSSSHDVSKDDEKEIPIINKDKSEQEMEAIKSLGSILSMLQDRTKMKHILTLLKKDNSAETEKFKRRLAKLSEIASDDEEVEPTVEALSNSALLEHKPQCSQDLVSNAIASQVGGSVQTVFSETSVRPSIPGLDAALKSNQTTKITEPLNITELKVALDSQTSSAPEVGESELGIASENHNATLKSNASKENMVDTNKEQVETTDKVRITNKDRMETIERRVDTNKDTIIETEEVMDSNKYQMDATEKVISTNTDEITITGKVNKDHIDAIKIQPHVSHTETDMILLPRISVKKRKAKSKTLTRSRDNKSLKKNKKKLTKQKIKTSLEEKRTTRADSVQKIPTKEKGKGKKGELQKLQEDIRDMFISQGVLNATGIRMCRLAKLTDDKSDQVHNQSEDISPKLVEKKIAKNISKKDTLSTTGKDPTPLVVLEKTAVSDSIYDFKINEDEVNAVAPLPKIRKKPGPKPRSKIIDSSAEVTELKKTLLKPGPKSKKRGFKKTEESKEIENTSLDSLSTSETFENLETLLDSDDESLSSLVSATSSERVKEPKPKQKRKKPMWQHGFIKNKNKKKTNKDIPGKKRPPVPDDTCFIDKKYCFAQNSPKYTCRLCDFEGENIVLHCKETHPHCEVPLSRINPKTATAAIEQSLNTDFDKFQKNKNTMVCRFCFQVFEGGNGRKIEKFFWHIVSKHTGEYKYRCSICTDEGQCPSSLDIPTPPSEGQQLLLGYICGECHYTQISLNNLKTHVALRHDNEETEVYTINLCDLPPDDKVKAPTINRGKYNKTPENNQSIRQLRPRRDASLSEADLLKTTFQNFNKPIIEAISVSKPAEMKSTGNMKSKRIGPKLTFEDDSTDENTQSGVFESGSETIKSEREDTDVPEGENNTDDNLDGSSSRRSSVSSDIRLISENTEFVEYLRRVQIKQEPVEEKHEEIHPTIEYDKSPHFMITNSTEGTKSAKLYVCRVKGCGIGYKTSLLIGLKMHVQSKHLGWRDIWDGYCCVCKQVTNETSSRSSRNFSDCLNHMLMNHLDDFPVQTIDEKASSGTDVTANIPKNADRAGVEYPKPKKYISVKPMTDLIAKSPTTNDEPKYPVTETTTPLVQNVASLQSTSEAEDLQPATSLDGAAEPTPCIPRDVKTKEPLTSPVDALTAIVTEKHSVVREHMLEASKLACLFKCAGRYCSFVCRDASSFIVHVSAHLKFSSIGADDVLRCAYCEHRSAGGALLAAHVLSAHGHCRYSCPHCWYLATSPVLVETHRARAHPAQPTAPTLALKPLDLDESAGMRGMLQRAEVVPLYTCSMQVTVDGHTKACSFRGYTAPKYREHLELRHPAAAEFQCFACPDKFPRPSNLIGHLKQHGLGLFQCTFCLCGADTEQEMLEHAARYHPTKRPQAYLRHVFESKDVNASEKKFKSLPLMRLGQQGLKDITITAPPILENNDCPNTEAERAHALQNLILQHQDSSTPTASSDGVEESDVLMQKTIPDLSVPELTKQQNTIKSVQENSAVGPEETVSSIKREPIDASDSSKRLNENNSRKKTLEEYIICLDSDDEDQKPLLKRPASPKGCLAKVQKTAEAVFSSLSKDIDIIDLSDDDSASEVPKTDNSKPEARYALDKLFKCQKCQQTCKNDYYYRHHLTKCYPDPNDHPKCPYCLTTTASRKEIRFHLIQSHGPTKTYRCSICDMSVTQSKKLVQHMHVDHNIDYVTVNLESPSSETANMKYVVQPDTTDTSTKHKARARPPSPKTYSKPGPKPRSKQPVKRPAEPKPILRYGPEDIDRLPHNPILESVIQCSRCDFGTKVRSNMIRHLQMHANEQAVPSAAPVNPVPHLESNEMHFDKMTNLAASSNAARPTERLSMSTANVPSVTPELAAKYPKFVPDKERNACGAVGCAYISLDESLLKYHWDTLHTDLVHGDGFHCVHCPPNQQVVSPPVTAGRIVAHLKMHGPRLYGCADCGYYNHVLVTVEKHNIEKHGMSRKGVTAIRESGETIAAPTPGSAASPTTEPKAAPTMDLKPWQCGICKFKTMLRPEITEHCSRSHGFKFQFKCAFCPYSGSVQTSVARHQSERHVGRSAPDVIQVYYKEPSLQVDEEGSPLWMRQRKFLDIGDSVDVKPEVDVPSRAPSAAPNPTLPTPPAVVNLAIVKSEVEEEVEETPKEVPDTIETVSTRFGAIGDPRGEQYLCPLCKVTTEEDKSLFITHLYEELNYRKFSCSLCSYKAFSKQRMQEHTLHEHKQSQEPLELPPDIEVEIWLDNLIKHQDNIIAANKAAKNALIDQTQAKPKEAPTIQFKPGEGPSLEVLSQLEQMFGPLETSNDDNFACPKCEFTTADENDILQHLEMELGKIRWACSGCSQKFQHYHVAQQHCSSGKHTSFVHVTAVSKDPSQRTLWIDCVIRAQRKTSQTTAASASTSQFDRNESVDSLLELDTSNNSLLVVRYEESVPGPQEHEQKSRKQQPTRKRKPTSLREDDSDEEPRLIIADKSPQMHACAHCDYRTNNASVLRTHALRHFNMRPYTCGYCEYSGYKSSLDKHLKRDHPDLPAKWITNKVPTDTAAVHGALPMPKNTKGLSRKNSLDTPVSSTPATSKPSTSKASTSKTLGSKAIATPSTSKSSTKTTPKQPPPTEELTFICLLCEIEIPQPDVGSHHKACHTSDEDEQIVERGKLVLKCGACMSLRTDQDSLKKHHEEKHKGSYTSYTLFRSGSEQRDALVCDHCGRMFTFLKDLKCHHFATHSSLQLQYSKKPCAVSAATKRKHEEDDTSVKCVAKKSTTKLPFALKAVARKSTTKLPFNEPEIEEISSDEEEELSHYGMRPEPIEKFNHIQTQMPFFGSMVPVTIQKFSGLINVSPVVTVLDYKKVAKKM